MSGGSYEYLCYKSAEDMLQYGPRQELQRMVKRLIELGELDVAKEMEQFVLFLDGIEARIQARVERYHDVMHAVEWFDSGDYGDDSFKEALAAWREKW